MLALKVVAIGDEHGIVLPAELIARLYVQQDGTVLAEEAPDGVTLLSPDAVHEAQMQVARRLMEKHAGLLSALATS